jgi:hypothetical protein
VSLQVGAVKCLEQTVPGGPFSPFLLKEVERGGFSDINYTNIGEGKSFADDLNSNLKSIDYSSSQDEFNLSNCSFMIGFHGGLHERQKFFGTRSRPPASAAKRKTVRTERQGRVPTLPRAQALVDPGALRPNR